MNKKENENKKDLARMLYLNGTEMGAIAEKLGVSRQSVTAWKKAGAWEQARAAKNITRPEIVNRVLLSIDRMLTEIEQSEDTAALSSLGDKLSKLASVIEKLDKKANIVDTVEVFMAFSKWIEFRAKDDATISVEFLKQLNKLQDEYVIELSNRR